MTNIKRIVGQFIPYTSFEKLLFGISVYQFLAYCGVFMLPKIVCYLVQLFMTVLVFQAYQKCPRRKLSVLDKDFQFALKCFMAWIYLMMFRFFEGDVLHFHRLFFSSVGFLCYVSPFIVYLDIDERRLKELAKWAMINIVLYCGVVYSFRSLFLVTSAQELWSQFDEEMYWYYLNIGQLISFAYVYIGLFVIHGKMNYKTFLFIALTTIIGVVIPLLLGRRSACVMVLMFVLLYFVLKFRTSLSWILFLFVIIGGLYNLYLTYEAEIEQLLPILFNRLTDDTRTWAEQELYKDFDNDYWSILFGRGILGMYYSPTYGPRTLIETGWLQMILKGGVVFLFLYLYILLSSFIKGFFCSRNRLINAMALYVFANILFLYPAGYLSTDLRMICLWICVGCCSCKALRKSKTFDVKI